MLRYVTRGSPHSLTMQSEQSKKLVLELVRTPDFAATPLFKEANYKPAGNKSRIVKLP
jgi:hypothetical protein